jgi:hypothetical protein
MDPKLTEVAQMFARFKAAYARNDLDACVTLLSQLKVRARRPRWICPARRSPPRSFGSTCGFHGGCFWGFWGWDFRLAAVLKDAIFTCGSMASRIRFVSSGVGLIR